MLSRIYLENTRVNNLETKIRNGDVTGRYTKLFVRMMNLRSSLSSMQTFYQTRNK